MLPCVGREHYQLSVTDVCRGRVGDETIMLFRVPEWLVNIAHFQKSNEGNCHLVERFRGQPEKMADGARLVCNFQPPLWTVAKPCDGVADHIRTCPRGLVPRRVIIQQVDGHVA
jgi:hypothetical protein